VRLATGALLGSTARAVLVEVADRREQKMREVWIPKSQIHKLEQAFVDVAQWWAKERGLT
jgi:hypothetical protein